MRLCQRGGAPSLLCTAVHALLIPQLPAALSPPALFAAVGGLAYAAAWVLYQTAALTIPLALWLAFAAGGSLGLSPAAVAAAGRLSPAAGDAAARLAARSVPLPAPLAGHPWAALVVLPVLLVLLRLAESAVLARRLERWQRRQARVTAADVQAAYAGWALPGSPGGASPSAASAAAAAEAEQVQRQQLDQLRREVGRLWAAVYGGESLPAEQLGGLQGERWAGCRVRDRPPLAGRGSCHAVGAHEPAECACRSALAHRLPLLAQTWLQPWGACAVTQEWSCRLRRRRAAPTPTHACC